MTAADIEAATSIDDWSLPAPAVRMLVNRVLDQPAALLPAPGQTIGQAATAWFSQYSKKVDKATFEDRKSRVLEFVNNVGTDTPLASITRKTASTFLRSIEAKGLHGRTVRKYANALSMVI